MKLYARSICGGFLHAPLRSLIQGVRFMSSSTPQKPPGQHLASPRLKTVTDIFKEMMANPTDEEKLRMKRHKFRHLQVPLTLKYAARVGLTPSDVDKVSVIHVTGTKGKGSTGAFCESILRHHGKKTGFFNSPHLVDRRERFRINGNLLEEEKFKQYVFDCYDKLKNAMEHDNDMPYSFRFLTILAFHIFLQEKVDVAIIEVGVGGRYDCTNIVRSPVVCGVSTLDLDHTNVLGDTIEEIAWNKGGIFKTSVPAVTVPQPDNAMHALLECAKHVQCPLSVTPDLESYDCGGLQLELGMPGSAQRLNASLALQLCHIWIKDHEKGIEKRKMQYSTSDVQNTVLPGESFFISEKIRSGLKNCQLRGHKETLRREGLTYYLDGAHTIKSMQQCVEWFLVDADKEKATIRGKVMRVLMFNTTGDRKPEALLGLLKAGNFDFAVFCPNITSLWTTDIDISIRTLLNEHCVSLRNIWVKLTSESTTIGADDHINGTLPRQSDDGEIAYTFQCIKDTLTWIGQSRNGLKHKLPGLLWNPIHIQILCTGSIGLVGGVIELNEPNTVWIK